MADQQNQDLLQEVKITKGDLLEILAALRKAEVHITSARQLELDLRMLRTRMEGVLHDLEPITRRVTPPPGEVTIVKLPADWPDQGAKRKPSGSFPR